MDKKNVSETKKEVLWQDTEALEEMKIYLLHYSISLYPQSNVVEREPIMPSEYNNSGKSKAASLRQIKQVVLVCHPCSSALCSADPSSIRLSHFMIDSLPLNPLYFILYDLLDEEIIVKPARICFIGITQSYLKF